LAKIGIFYGSSTGTTSAVAGIIRERLGTDLAALADIAAADPAGLLEYPLLILCSSTWGAGEMQDDWKDFLPLLADIDLSRVRVGIVGLGDQENYPDTFVDAIGILADRVRARGAWLAGLTSTDGYDFASSMGREKGRFLGLALDEDNQSDLTSDRVDRWLSQLRTEFGLTA
jgi:flavodoxin I